MPPKSKLATKHGYGRKKVSKKARLANLQPKHVSIAEQTETEPATPQSARVEALQHRETSVVSPTGSSCSASSSKLSRWTSSPSTSSFDVHMGFITVSKASLNHLLESLLCSVCMQGNMSLGPLHLKNGMCMTYNVLCSLCGNEKRLATDSPDASDNLTRRTVLACKDTGISFEQLERFWGVTDTDGMNRKRFYEEKRKIETDCNEKIRLHFDSVCKFVREKYESQPDYVPSEDGILDVVVTFDGTWQKRGRTSHNGVGVVIELLTGFVIDFECISNFCAECEKHKNDDEWMQSHRDSGRCEKNFDGNSGMMEPEAAKEMWKRSIEKNNMRYAVMLSDGHSKAFDAVSKLELYDVKKEECINHVAKRMRSRLDTLKKNHKGKGGGSEGRVN